MAVKIINAEKNVKSRLKFCNNIMIISSGLIWFRFVIVVALKKILKYFVIVNEGNKVLAVLPFCTLAYYVIVLDVKRVAEQCAPLVSFSRKVFKK